jgi:hypothetical protein
MGFTIITVISREYRNSLTDLLHQPDMVIGSGGEGNFTENLMLNLPSDLTQFCLAISQVGRHYLVENLQLGKL